jgi:hypothetical protein
VKRISSFEAHVLERERVGPHCKIDRPAAAGRFDETTLERRRI